MATIEELTCQNWSVPPPQQGRKPWTLHLERVPSTTDRDDPQLQVENIPYHRQRALFSPHLESRPHVTTREQPLEHRHLRGAVPNIAIRQKPPSTTREEAPMPQLKWRSHTKFREQACKYHTWKDCLCTSLPERKPPAQFERNTPLQL